MNIKKYIKEAHGNAVDKGFYNCGECEGKKYINCGCNEEPDRMECPECSGTGINQNKNIGEFLMLVVTEISEAIEAHREGSFAGWGLYNISIEKKEFKNKYISFEMYIKNTFEDEISDVFIRLFDLMGYLKIEYKDFEHKTVDCAENVAESLFDITGMIYKLKNNIYQYQSSLWDKSNNLFKEVAEFLFFELFNYLKYFCTVHNVENIEKHIQTKMEYNKTREYKHGKEY